MGAIADVQNVLPLYASCICELFVDYTRSVNVCLSTRMAVLERGVDLNVW